MNRVMLYIEDDDNNISLVKALLKRRPQIELQVAMNGRDGIQAAIDKQPALILLDNRLPDATGTEILGELASLPATHTGRRADERRGNRSRQGWRSYRPRRGKPPAPRGHRHAVDA